jgi:hypothetical protein
VTYTKSGKELFLAVINDGQAAVSFLCLNAKLFNSRDPKRFRAAGESSGGHITAQLATTSKSNEHIKHAFHPKGIVGHSGGQSPGRQHRLYSMQLALHFVEGGRLAGFCNGIPHRPSRTRLPCQGNKST